MSEPMPPIVARDLCKTYVGGDGTPIQVLEGTNLEVRAGETVAIIGASGSGKSTLLHLLGGLDLPTRGEVFISGTSLGTMDEEAVSRLRNRSIGFVFQFHHLLREFTVLENVMMPQLIAGVEPRAARERARQLLAEVGLEGRLLHKPAQLSGGEQQRGAVARALVNRPVVLLADEPSGNLDPSTSGRLHDLLFEVGALHNAAMVLVTHNMTLAARANRVLELQEGRLAVVEEDPFGPAAPRPGRWPRLDREPGNRSL